MLCRGGLNLGLCKHRRRSYASVLLPCAYTHNVEHFVFSKFIMCSPLRLYYYYEKREREKGDASEHNSINGLENDETGKRQGESDSEHVQNGMWEYTQMVVAIHRKIRDIVRTRTNFNTPNCSECLNLWAVSVFASTRFSYFLCDFFSLFSSFYSCFAEHSIGNRYHDNQLKWKKHRNVIFEKLNSEKRKRHRKNRPNFVRINSNARKNKRVAKKSCWR